MKSDTGMKNKNKSRLLLGQLAALFGVCAAFALLNFCFYALFTAKLGTGFGPSSTLRMADVSRYLPFEEASELARVKSSLRFSIDDELPVLDGAAALLPVYASVIDSVYPEGCVTYEGGSFSDDNYYGENFAKSSAMQYKNTVRGYKAVVDGETDILFCAAPSEEQRAYAEEKGVQLVFVPIGREAFVFFVNAKNPVDGLSSGQIRDIYGGKIRNWSEVGGVNRPIDPVFRIEGSGSRSAMDAFMGDAPYGKKSPFALFGASLGYSFRFYLGSMAAGKDVKMLSLDGIEPTTENIRSGKYPAVSEFYAVYREDNRNPNIPRLIEWLLSEEGQTTVERAGYVGIK